MGAIPELNPAALASALQAYERNDRLNRPIKSNVAAAIEAYLAAAPDYYESHEVLGDIVSLESEHQALNGGGPGWKSRWDKAMQRACEIFEG